MNKATDKEIQECTEKVQAVFFIVWLQSKVWGKDQ